MIAIILSGRQTIFCSPLGILCFAIMVSSCAKADHNKKEPSLASERATEHVYKISINGKPLWVEVADSEEERTQGLMFRKSLEKNNGMLFVFDRPEPLSFWMKNTYIPLGIAFVNEKGVILSIQKMKPLDETPRYESPAPSKYAIEANLNWFEENNVKVGDKITF